MAENKCSLQNMLSSILSVANQEQNAFYPPSIYQQHYNAVSSYLLSEIAEVYPSNQRYKDVITPFLKIKLQPVKGGLVEIPDDCRNFLDAGIYVQKDYAGECKDLPQQVIEKQFQDSVSKSKCQSRPVQIVEQSEWDDLTTHPYNYPTYRDPIGCFFDSKNLKICPFDIANVEIRYLINEETYVYGYTTLPDGTYINDPSTTKETQWDTNAFKFFFKGISALYGIFTRDNEVSDFGVALKKIGLI